MTMMVPLSEAAAQTVFMVQLGSFKSEDEAKTQWDKLSTSFPDLFQPLTYAPTEVMLPPDEFVYHRTQAGPIATRDQADDICERVVSGGYECYVVETAMFTAPYNENESMVSSARVSAPVQEESSNFFDSAADEAELAPAAPQVALEQALAEPAPAPVAPPAPVAASVAVAPAPVVPESVQLASAEPASQMMAAPAPAPIAGNMPAMAPSGSPFGTGPSVPAGGSTASAAPAPVMAPYANVAGSRADVSVAEAIPVPLSNLNQKSNQPYASGYRGTPSSYNRNMAFWAEIGYFESQSTALGYWNVLRQRDRSIPGGLRLRVTQPFTQKHLAQKMSLRVGPFTNVNAIRRLCSFTRPEKLGCRAVRDLGGAFNPAAQTMGGGNRLSGANGYSVRRTMQRNDRVTAGSPSGQVSASPSGDMFWIQLGAFMAPQAALDKWAELQLLHKAELGSLNEQIYSPAGGARNLFRLRAGPFARAGDAVSTCEALKRKGTLCVVVSER